MRVVSVAPMAGVTEEQLGHLTLQRQFPSVRGTNAEAVVALLDRLGPLQSQVPRAPFDLSFFFGVGLTQVDAAVTQLGDELVRLAGSDEQTYLDLAEPPDPGDDQPGLRLLAEFDALLLGFCGRGRTRFVDKAGHRSGRRVGTRHRRPPPGGRPTALTD